MVRETNCSVANRWLQLLEDLQFVSLSDSHDRVEWMLSSNKSYLTRSLYRFLTDRGVASRIAGYIWKAKIPLKIKIFLWQVFNNKLQVAQSLIRRGWKGNLKCCLCVFPETVNHIFSCHLAKFVWSIIREIFNIGHKPNSLEEFCSDWMQGKGPVSKSLLTVLFGFAWTLWTT